MLLMPFWKSSLSKGFRLLPAILVLLLSACSSTKTVSNIEHVVTTEAMYLRGVFNWWEIDERYRLVESKLKVYSTTVNLIADGQPYDFKIADKNWTPGLSCGALPGKGQVSLDSKINAFCDANSENFKFTPEETGVFRFILDFSHLTPRLTIVREGS